MVWARVSSQELKGLPSPSVTIHIDEGDLSVEERRKKKKKKKQHTPAAEIGHQNSVGSLGTKPSLVSMYPSIL